MHHPTDRIAHTTAFVTPVVVHWLEREIAQWVHPMKDRSDDQSHHERTLLPRSYILMVVSVSLILCLREVFSELRRGRYVIGIKVNRHRVRISVLLPVSCQ